MCPLHVYATHLIGQKSCDMQSINIAMANITNTDDKCFGFECDNGNVSCILMNVMSLMTVETNSDEDDCNESKQYM